MPRRDLSLPLAIIATGVVLIGLFLLDWPSSSIRAQADDDPCPVLVYPDPNNRLICQQTQTALAVTSTPYPNNTPTPPPPPPPNQGQDTITPPTPTRTATSIATPTARLANVTPTATNAVIITPPPPPNGAGTPTPTSLFEGLETLVCQPGSEVVIEGLARPNTALLLFFNERPVGGTLSRVDGRYRAPMRIGRERPGFYLVEVRERDGLTLVRQLACAVPNSTPTPNQRFGR